MGGVTVRGGRIVAIDILADRERLRELDLTASTWGTSRGGTARPAAPSSDVVYGPPARSISSSPMRARRTRSRERATAVVSRCVPEGYRSGALRQAELDVDRSGDPNDLGDLVQPHEAAEVVGRLDVDVERDVDRRPDGRELREREVDGHVDGVRAELLEHARRRCVGGGQHDRELGLHVLGQLAGRAHRGEQLQDPEVGDQHAAEPQLRRVPDLVELLDHLLDAPRRRREPAPAGARADTEAPQPALGRANRLTSTRLRGRERRHRGELGVREQGDARALRDAMHAGRRAGRPPPAPPRGSAGPRCSGSRRDTRPRPGSASRSSAPRRGPGRESL